jgi:alpha-amylase/alpha-mannosidase (GH57 family)
MAQDSPLYVLFLWHQHQPLYKDALSNRYELPWVRLHATKDYYDMAALLEDYPTVKANFNLVPSLLAQLDDYAEGKAQDKFLDMTLKKAAELSFEDHQFILQNFFMAHWEHMIDPYVRYRELLDKRGRTISQESLSRAQKYFKEQDWRDLQVWFNLTWFDPLWREKDPFIKSLFEKGKNFSEEEKEKLAAKQQEICGLVVAKHKDLQERGQIEVTTTPFYHPILPLLCDTDVARMALPHIALPEHRFQHPEDARHQVQRAVEDYRRRFGRDPQGMWPAEGSVSEEAARLFMETGIRWVATDEAVLANSMNLAQTPFQKEDIFEPYQLLSGDKSLRFFFRDHELSDAIGFVYASWDPETAANDFMRRLHEIKGRLKARDGAKLRPHIVSVILDGENCWEYYRQDGIPFLRALYSRLAADTAIQTVRASDYLGQAGEIKKLSKLWSGSWINSNFAIWIGHPEDNLAWDLLHRTRGFLQAQLQTKPELADAPATRQAWEEIHIAEGSDWCWWYGEDHSSANDDTFDYLFRKHLMNVYALMGEKIPEDLHLPIKKKRLKSPIIPPADFVKPQIDGRITSYFEWHSAGLYHTEAGGTGTMHKAENLIKSIYFGFDLENLYFRLDPNRQLTPESWAGCSLKFIFYKPEGQEVIAAFQPDHQLKLSLHTTNTDVPFEGNTLEPGIYQKIIELAIPIKALNNPNKQDFEILILVQKEGLEQERWPVDATLKIPYPNSEVFLDNWVI